MPEAADTIKRCEEAYEQLSSKMDAILDQFIEAAESGKGFNDSVCKIDEQIAAAKRLIASRSDLDLNETIVLAEKIEAELAAAELSAQGAALAEMQDEWAEEIENAKSALERLSFSLSRMKAASQENESLEVRAALLAFRREEKAFRSSLKKLNSLFNSKSHPAFSKLRSSKMKVAKIKAEVGKALEALSKRRLRIKIAQAKQLITEFVRKEGKAKVFVDAKHLSMFAGGRMQRVPLTQAVRFALEELAPIKKHLSQIGKNGTVLVGRIEKTENGPIVRIGKRFVAGDSVICQQQTFPFDA
jgi:peptidyl-tRNA hydrolase